MVFQKGHKINIGRKHTEEYKDNLRRIKTGLKYSEESKRKMSEARMGKPPANKGIPCSNETKKKISKANKGRKNKWGHHSQETKIKISAFQQGISVEEWKGFKISMNRFLKNTAKYQIWRNLVFLRDNFICQNPNCEFCNNEIGIYLQAHHIKSLKFYPELAFDVNNGITYCKNFHIRSGLHQNMIREVN